MRSSKRSPTRSCVSHAVTICGTDLYILGGGVPEVAEGRILGHEAVGTVNAVGSTVQKLAVGDRVLVWCISSCGSCRYCRVHGAPATLHLEDIWIKNLTITTGLVDTYSTPTLIGLVASHQLDTSPMIAHRFGFAEFETAYDVFGNAADTGALKVLLTATRKPPTTTAETTHASEKLCAIIGCFQKSRVNGYRGVDRRRGFFGSTCRCVAVARHLGRGIVQRGGIGAIAAVRP
jgi:hypothetical protein